MPEITSSLHPCSQKKQSHCQISMRSPFGRLSPLSIFWVFSLFVMIKFFHARFFSQPVGVPLVCLHFFQSCSYYLLMYIVVAILTALNFKILCFTFSFVMKCFSFSFKAKENIRMSAV